MRFGVCLLTWLTLVAVDLPREPAAAQSPCSNVARDYLDSCVDEIGNFQCRNRGSVAAHQACFEVVARRLIGDRIDEVGSFEPTCFENAPGYVLCSIITERGGPGEWCIRLDASRIKICEGESQSSNYTCKPPVVCALARCELVCLVAR
jgi:hypothetical protein